MKNTMSQSEMRAEILALLDAVDKLPKGVEGPGFMKMGACRSIILLDSGMDDLEQSGVELEFVRSWDHYGVEHRSGILEGVEITGPAGRTGGDNNA